jgi:hypothetical protein
VVDPEWETIPKLPRVDYGAYLESDAWRQKRAYLLRRTGHRCQVCNRATRLEVHHRTYARLGHEDPRDLTVLCHDCHQLFHAEGKPLDRGAPLSLPEWGNPATIGGIVCLLAAGWSYLNMRQWSTYDGDPFGYLWRFGRFLAFLSTTIVLFSKPPRLTAAVIWGGIGAVILALTWLFG